MAEPLVCPEEAALERLVLGLSADDEAESLEHHLLACDRCCQVARSLPRDETLAGTSRHYTHLAKLIDDEVVRQTMVRLKEVLPAVRVPQPEETITVGGESTGDGWGLEELLDSPQGVGELGWFGGYRVLRVLGAGGMGLVLEAEDPQLRRRVALKVMRRSLAARAEHRERFLREARAAAAIDHPHIVTVHQVGEHRGVPFLAMQLLKGENLQDRLSREETAGDRDQQTDDRKSKIQNPKSVLPLAECLRIGRETAEALAEAHRCGLIHRDIKPANVWLESPGGWVKLVDFGLAHALEGDVQLTETGAILGTPAYMSPEQARGDNVRPQTDLFSLGVVLYRLTSGQTPFRGPSTMAILTALATAAPRPLRELNPEAPPALAALVMRLLAKDPDERFESAEAVVEAIRAIEAAGGPKSLVPSPKSNLVAGAERSNAPARRGPMWPWLVAVAGAAALLLSGIVVVIRDKDGREVARLSVPEGGSVTTEGAGPATAQASGMRKLPGSSDATSGLVPTADVIHREANASRSPGAADAASPPSRRAGIEATLPDRDRPFLLVREGKQAGEFKTFAGALGEMQTGDAIEVYGNGPFALPIVHLDGKPFTLRAGAGFRPRFVRSEKARQRLDSPWIMVNNAPLTLEGIELREEQPADRSSILHGGGAPWEIRRCLLRKADSHVGALIDYKAGPRLRIVDSVLISGHGHGSVGIGAPTEVFDFENNLYWNGSYTFFSFRPYREGQKFRFKRNTFAGGGHWLSNDNRPETEKALAAVDVLAEENVFRFTGHLLSPRGLGLEEFREVCRWTGHRNLYGLRATVDTSCSLIRAGDRQPGIAGDDLAGWNTFWGEREQGALLDTSRALLYELGWLPDETGGPLPRLRHWLDPRRLDPPSSTSTAASENDAGPRVAAGPDWRLIGPGEAYLRALADAGHPVADEQLRLEATEDGAVVLLHENQPERAYETLAEAVAAAADGDTVTIRSNGTFAGFDRRSERQGKRLTLRAAYGYRPTIGDLNLAPGDMWSIEGLHFTGQVLVANSAPAADGQRAPRVLNCSFEHALQAYVTSYSESAAPLEVVNCLLPNLVNFAGARLRVVNSAIAGVGLNPIEPQRPRTLELDRCVVWSNIVPAIQHHTVPLTVSARRTWFEFMDLLCMGDAAVFQWQGDDNVYCHGARKWQADRAANVVAFLPAWQARWSSDAGSRQGDAVFIDPRFCGLLPESPGHQAAQDGNDLGVDLSRLGLSAASDQVAPALRDGSADR